MILLQDTPLGPEHTETKDRVIKALSEMHAVKIYTSRGELETFLDDVLAGMPTDMPKGLTRVIAFIKEPWAAGVIMHRMAFGFTATFYTQPECWTYLKTKLPEMEALADQFHKG